MFDFTNKIVLAVGGAGYLCFPACQALAAQGASVVLTDLDLQKAQDSARELETEYSGSAIGLSCDVGDENSIRDTIKATVEKFGRIDILINAAYKGSHANSPDDMPHDAFDAAAHVQLSGTFLLARESEKVMPDGGAMLFFSSMYGSISPEPAIYHAPMQPNPIDYGVVKAGLEQMIRYLAVHFAPRDIRVNGVAPGAFPHAIAAGFGTPEFEAFQQRLAKKAPLNRVGRQNELAGPVVFLVSDQASFVTGQTLPVDGGWTIW